MNHIILASHSNLAQGMYDSLKFFNNDLSNVSVICAYEDGLNFETTLRAAIEKAGGKNIIIFTDIFGGSVNQVAVKLIKEYPIHVVSGMNLPLLLALIFDASEINEDAIQSYITQGKDQMVYLNSYIKNTMADGDE